MITLGDERRREDTQPGNIHYKIKKFIIHFGNIYQIFVYG